MKKRRRHTQSDGDVKMEEEIRMLAATKIYKRHRGTISGKLAHMVTLSYFLFLVTPFVM